MTNQNTIDMFVATKGEFFPPESITQIKNKLSSLDNERLIMATSMEYKKPMIMLLVSIFLGYLGIDRFLLGHTSYGIIKLLTGGGCGIWWLIDLFKITSMTKEDNYKKFTSIAGN